MAKPAAPKRPEPKSALAPTLNKNIPQPVKKFTPSTLSVPKKPQVLPVEDEDDDSQQEDSQVLN